MAHVRSSFLPRSSRRTIGRRARGLTAVGAVLASVAMSGRLATSVHASALRNADPDSDAALLHDRSRVRLSPWDSPDAVMARVYMSGVASPTKLRELVATVRQSASGQAPAGEPQALRFDIPPGPLDTALKTFATVTRLAVTVSNDLTRGLTSPGVTGVVSAERALTALLAGTGLTFRMTTPGAVVVELRANAESVQVTGQATPAVSSTKYTAPLREIPQTIEVIPRALMEQQGAVTLSDALRNVPGISLQAGEGGGASSTAGDMFTMRGFSANNSLFVDGVRDDGLVSRDIFNLEQVEVFLGPTGSDVGRGTAAGYVNMATKLPHLGAAYASSFAYGAADQKRLTIDVNHGLSTKATGGWRDHAAVRLNALWQDGGVAGRDVVRATSQSVAPSLAIGLGTSTRLTAGAQVARQDNLPDYGIPASAWRDEPLTPTTVLASKPVASSNFYGSVGYDYDKVEQENYTARIEHDVRAGLSLRNQTRYNRTHRTAAISAIQSPTSFIPTSETVTIARQGNERENEILSNQTSLTAAFTTGQLRHAVSGGVEFSADEQFAPTLTGLGTRAAVDIYAPNPHDPITGFAPVRSAAYTKGRTHTAALYGFDSVNIGRHWLVSGGLRLEYFDTAFQSVDATGATTVDQVAKDSLISGKAAVQYRLRENANIYFSYGTSLTPPGTANFTLSAQPNNQNSPNVEPQESTNYEVGAKWGLADDRVMLNAAVFHTKNANVIFTVDATAVPPLFNQDDGQRVDGATMGVTGRITNRWEVMANVGYLDTELETQNTANNGGQLTLTPPWSGSLWTSYRGPGGLTLGGGIRHTDPVFVNAANTIRVPGYRVVDALVEYAVNSHLTLRLNVTNVTDATYIRNVNNNGGRYNPGAPRAAMLTSRVTF